jgi:hypothetical protein
MMENADMRKVSWRLGLAAILVGLATLLTIGCGPSGNADSKGSKAAPKDSKLTPPPKDRD